VGSTYKNKEEPVPGARTIAAIERDISFDWRKVVGPRGLAVCDQLPAFQTSRRLAAATKRLFGPTCALGILGGFQTFASLSASGEVERYIGPDGDFIMIGISMDMTLGYLGEYMDVLKLEREALFEG